MPIDVKPTREFTGQRLGDEVASDHDGDAD